MTLDEAIKHAEEVMIENLEKTMNRNSSDPIAIQCYECADEHRQLAEWLKDYKRLLEQTQWIPVSERLPEETRAVLVWCPQYKNIYCAYLKKEQWWIFGAFFQIVPNEVIAWLPLPEPYREEGETDAT